jgi:hypothetical protein
MTRPLCFTAALLLVAGTILPAQSRDRDRNFGRPNDAWCRDARDADFCDVREETLNNVSTIDVDARGNGGVFVRGWDRSDVRVRARISTYARTDDDARALAREVRLTTQNGTIRAEGPRRDNDRDRRRWRNRESWHVSYEIQVPRSARVSVDATNGGIVVQDVRGTIDAETTNGGLVFSEVAGDVRGRATNGGVVVEVAGEKWQGTGLDVRTTNGGVRLLLPAGYSADLDARATNGGISIDFPVTVQGLVNSRREVRGTIGSGGPPLRVATTNGGVQIRRR